MNKSYAIRKITLPGDLRGALVSAAAMLASFGSALALEHLADLNLDVIVLAVVLSLSLGRTYRGGATRAQALALAVLVVVAVCAGQVGRLMHDHPDIGDTLFTLALSGAVWLRRFGPRATAIGTTLTLPFIAILITPLPVPPGPGSTLWSAAAAAIAFVWVSLLRWLAERTGFTAPAAAPPATPTPTPARLPASTKMALQMAAALAAAFVVGRTFFSVHWTWVVLTAFIVSSGNRGRGDVVLKACQRIAGAAVGTVAATLLAGAFPPGSHVTVALMLAVLAVAAWLRTINYGYWAGCVTGVLALLYGYFGQTGVHLLQQRLGGILVGAALAIAAAWLVLPIPSTQVLRRRAADVLAVHADLLAAVRDEPAQLDHHRTRFRQALAAVDQVARPLELHHRLTRLGGRSGTHPAEAVYAIRASAPAVENLSPDDRTSIAHVAKARGDLARILKATRPH